MTAYAPTWQNAPYVQSVEATPDKAGMNANANVPRISSEEVQLIERCKAGDAAAWDQLFNTYQPFIYRIAYSFCANINDASDIAGHVFVQVYLKLHTFRVEASFNSWIYRIVRNAYLDMNVRPIHCSMYSLDTGPTQFGGESWGNSIPETAPSPEALCCGREKTGILTRAIGNLPGTYREMLVMYHLKGITYAEIANATGLPIGTVKSRLNRAKSLLRERLAPMKEVFIGA